MGSGSRRDPMTLDDVLDWSNLLDAAHAAARGKRGRAPAAAFELRLADHLVTLQHDIRTRQYRPGGYVSFTIHEPKRRLISAAPFRDRVVHHALCGVIEPEFERRFIHDSYANRAGKGTHRAVDRCQQFARRHRYCLGLDVRQHFASIDHAILAETLERVIPDDGLRWLCDTIIASGEGVLSGHYDMVYFPGDDLMAATRPRGLPIGNLTSQFWSNCYLDSLDQFVKRSLKCRAYVRYADDMLIFGDDKRVLWEWKAEMVDFLANLRLTIHDARAQPRPTAGGIPCLGFVVYPTRRRVKRRKVIAFRRKLDKRIADYQAGRITFAELDATVKGWVNHVRYADTYGLRKAVLSKKSL